MRSIAEVTANNYQLGMVRAALENSGVRWLEDPCGEHHTSMYIYIKPHLRHIISCVLGGDYDDERFQSWLYGKLFGYGEEEIGQFLDIRVRPR